MYLETETTRQHTAKQPKVSVITATYNYGHYLPEAIQSVQQQTFTDWELLILDDGSTDHTYQIVQPFLTDRRIRYIRTENLGQPRAKNLGIRLSLGEWVAFLDGDDRWRSNKLMLQTQYVQQYPEVGVLGTRRQMMDPQGRPALTIHPEPLSDHVLEMLLERNPFCFSSMMIRRSILDQCGLFNPNYPLAIDYDLWLRMAEHTKFAILPEILVDYRTGHANLSRRLSERIRIVLKILRTVLIDYQRVNDVDPYYVREAFGTSYRSLGWSEAQQSWQAGIRYYIQAAKYDHRLLATLRSSLGILLKRLVK